MPRTRFIAFCLCACCFAAGAASQVIEIKKLGQLGDDAAKNQATQTQPSGADNLKLNVDAGRGSVTGLFRGVRYLDEVGHLGTDSDPRTSVDLTIAKAATTSDGDIEFSGKDDAGQKWSARLPVIGGIGWTTVWKADFDHNGRPDLMIASHFPGNGRCIENVTVSFLMIDAHGKPNPWVIRTNVPKDTAFPPIPAILTDLKGDDHAQIVVTDCEYSDRPRLGEDHSITGIYEARDSVWKLEPLTGTAAQERVTAIVLHSSAFRPGIDKLNPVDTARWSNLGNDHQQASGQITGVLPAEAGCRSVVRLGPVVDGKMTLPDQNDPCKERGTDRIRLSNGMTCYGWPTVILDRREGREIVAAESKKIPSVLQEITAQHIAVSLAGEATLGRCSPVLLTAESR